MTGVQTCALPIYVLVKELNALGLAVEYLGNEPQGAESLLS